MVTHTGQPPSRHVALEQVGVAGGRDWKRIGPDGKPIGGFPFRVPEGQMLVVTDVDWRYFGGTRGQIQTLTIFLRPLDDPEEEGDAVFESTIKLNNRGEGGISVAMTTGFVVSSNGFIFPEMDSPGGGGFNVRLRGYLCDES
ncbi:MAG: hypothetical protein WBN72_03050 [Nitrososphaeraceae archaeon]